MSLRRAVPGRSKSFDNLLKEHKAAKDALIKAKASNQSATAAASISNRVLVSPASGLKLTQSSPQVGGKCIYTLFLLNSEYYFKKILKQTFYIT